jgi:hypothetical protein
MGLAVLMMGVAHAEGAVVSDTIEGDVTDAVGRPVAGARVSDGYEVVYADASGHYVFETEDPIVGPYPLQATKIGFDPAKRVVQPGDDREDVDFEMRYSLQVSVTPHVLEPSQSLSITAWSYAPPGDSCVSWTDVGTGTEVTLALPAEPTDGENAWTGSFNVPADAADGVRSWVTRVVDCDTGVALSDPLEDVYVVDSVAPSLTVLSPIDWSAASTRLEVEVFDEVGVNPNTITVTVDGGVVPHSFRSSDQTDRVTATVTGLSSGVHQAEVSLADHAGHSAATTWQFTVDPDSPTSGESSPTGTIQDPSPEISAVVHDAASGIDPTSISMTLSNPVLRSRLDHSFDPATARVSYQIPDDIEGIGLGQSPLTPGTYEITLTLTDNVGNRHSTTWTFQVDISIP